MCEEYALLLAQDFVDIIDSYFSEYLIIVKVSTETFEDLGYGLLMVAEFAVPLSRSELLEHASFAWNEACQERPFALQPL